jgi:hypothetical protein
VIADDPSALPVTLLVAVSSETGSGLASNVISATVPLWDRT